MRPRHSGFTLTELLVVTAIMALLAGMLIPVFQRARESARRSRCLASIKNITAAITMYVTDWDRFWPAEQEQGVIEFFNNAPGGGRKRRWPDACERSYQANPYLRAPVVLEGYVRDREVWRCPDTRIYNGASMIVAIPADGYWLEAWSDHLGEWGQTQILGPCYTAWPSGWGGPITDSFAQGTLAIRGDKAPGLDSGIFLQSIGVNEHLRWQSLSSVDDPSHYVLCGDAGTRVDLWSAAQLAYPDTCGLGYSGGPDNRLACTGADWSNCTWTRNCGLSRQRLQQFYEQASYRQLQARHSGGSNVGFLDGHVKWHPAEAIITQSRPFPEVSFEGGLCSCWPGNGVLGPNDQPFNRDGPRPPRG